MDILSKIKQPIEAEMVRLNEVIAQMLASESPLLTRVVEHYLSTRGKQIRPILVLLAARLLGDVRPETIYGATAIELLHNATLIHDDVVDESKQRRGEATLNALWDNRVAVLAGDYFVSSATRAALYTREIKIMGILGDLGQSLSQGEIDQISVAQDIIIDEKAYFNVIRQKTASLFVACMQIGALTAGATEAQQQALMSFGEKLGLCFQIKDDIFDYFTADEVGKPTTGSDIAEGKITLPLIYALTHGEGSECDAMRELVRKSELSSEDINRLTDYAKRVGGIDYAEGVMQRLRDEAVACLSPFMPSEAAGTLLAVLDYTIKRTK